MKMIINPNINIYEHTNYVILYNTNTQLSYKVGVREYEILKLFLENNGNNEDLSCIQNEKLKILFENFTKNNILVEENYKENRRKNIIKTLYFTKDKIHTKKRNTSLEMILYLCIPVLIIGLFFTYIHAEQYMICIDVIKNNTFYTFMIFVIATFFSTIIHEAWHMFIAHNEGADVPQIGVKFIIITIWAYVKIIGVSSLEKSSRIKIYFAGIAANLFWGSLFLIIAWFFRFNVIAFATVTILGISNILQAFPNMLFILKLDGNYILEELFEIEDISKKALNFIFSKNRNNSDIITILTYIVFNLATLTVILSILLTVIYIGF